MMIFIAFDILSNSNHPLESSPSLSPRVVSLFLFADTNNCTFIMKRKVKLTSRLKTNTVSQCSCLFSDSLAQSGVSGQVCNTTLGNLMLLSCQTNGRDIPFDRRELRFSYPLPFCQSSHHDARFATPERAVRKTDGLYSVNERHRNYFQF